MKPFQVIILVAFGFLALAGLFVFATSKGLGGGSQEVGTVLIWGTLPQDAMDAALIELTYDPRYDGVSYEEVDEGSFSSALASAIAEGRGPDLLLISQEFLLAERAKIEIIPFETIPERSFVDAYVPMAELLLTPEGAYGVPFLVDPLVLYYDTNALLSAGVGGAPATWDGVTALAERLSRVSENRQVVLESAIPFGDYANVANARAILSLLLFQAGTPITSVRDTGVLSALKAGTQSGTVFAESALAFYTQFANPAKSVYSWNRALPLSTAAFISGQLALYPGFASERAYLSAANPNLTFDMARIPQTSTSDTRMTYANLYSFSVPRVSMNPVGAIEVAFALAAQGPATVAADALGVAPALRSLLTAPPIDRYATIYNAEALISRGWLSPSPAVTDSIFASMISSITSGRSEVDEAVRTADDSLEASL